MSAVLEFPTPDQWGAAPEDWSHFKLVLGLRDDLLPCVSNPRAQLAPTSALRELGKVPSTYNRGRLVVGFKDWTSHRATSANLATWSRERDFGICLQTRRVRAIDVDVTNSEQAAAIEAVLPHQLPRRRRSNSTKFLVLVDCPGELTKRRVKTEHGAIELLATGQHCVVVGTHPSGVRYAWDNGLPDAIPALALDQLEALWSVLVDQFGVNDSASESRPSIRAEKLQAVFENDPIARFLTGKGLVLRQDRGGRIDIDCPFAGEHTTGSSESSTSYWPANTGGYAHGHFRCLHTHCQARTDDEFRIAIGYVEPDQFEVLPKDQAPAREKFDLMHAAEIFEVPPLLWLVPNLITRHAEFGFLAGSWGTFKSFLAVDLGFRIAAGLPWHAGPPVAAGGVVYVACEGAHGIRRRFRACCLEHGLAPATLPFAMVADSPSFLTQADPAALAKKIREQSKAPPAMIVLDTWTRVTAGGRTNETEQLALATKHCQSVARATGAVVLAVAHLGKDETRGILGSVVQEGNADFILTAERPDPNGLEVVLRVTKQKDAEDGAAYGFTMRPRGLGVTNEDGAEDSCLVAAPNGSGAGGARPHRKLKTNEQFVLRVLDDYAESEVSAAKLVDDCVDQKVKPVAGKKDNRRRDVTAAVDSLVGLGVIVHVEGRVCKK
jgi:AAA domain-containing protein/bifunctional DNA primase/polymerase-like protein